VSAFVLIKVLLATEIICHYSLSLQVLSLIPVKRKLKQFS